MFQPLDVTCFKPFKIALKNKRNATMEKKNLLQPNIIILAKWVDKALQQSLKKENIKFGLKVCEIWSLNSMAMAIKFGPNEVFITIEEKDLGNSNHLNTTMQTNNSEDEAKAPTKLLNIAKTLKE
jgi:hypothetical protein